MPVLPVEDLRMVLKHSSKTYLQQDLTGHVFDCHPGSLCGQAAPGSKGPSGSQKQRVLVAAAKQQLVTDFVEGAKSAGLVAEQIVPSLIGPVNAFEVAMPQIFRNEVVALVDIGFKNSTICIVQQGELVLTRTVAIGGDRLTTSLSESMGISYAEAEGIKVGMAQEVQSGLQGTLLPLGRELRASIDFFEHQQDKAVSQVFISGGSARCPVIIELLQADLMVECKTWHPTGPLQIELPPEQVAELEQVGPQLTVALGAAFTAF
jgi:type IV pilus assembly protein PilM